MLWGKARGASSKGWAQAHTTGRGPAFLKGFEGTTEHLWVRPEEWVAFKGAIASGVHSQPGGGCHALLCRLGPALGTWLRV